MGSRDTQAATARPACVSRDPTPTLARAQRAPSGGPDSSSEESSPPFLRWLCLQPIRLRVLPVKVRPRELAVSPRSYNRLSLEVTPEMKARK